MKMVLKIVIGVLAVLILVLLFGPREPDDGDLSFSPDSIGADVDEYLIWAETPFNDITEGVEKQVIWANPETREKTDLALVYVHGFSATAQEIRPVPDRVAEALGANLYFTRLTGHGRDGDALAAASVLDWRNDLAEAMEIGRRIGERVVLIGTSSGGTMATLAADDPRMNADLAGVILVSPNFKVANPAAALLTLPFARQWVPIVAGAERSWEGYNDDHRRYWTQRYPTVATLPMAASVRAANAVAFAAIEEPVLMIFSEDDTVIDHSRTVEVAGEWGGEVTLVRVDPTELDDPDAHVIAGDILSPSQTDGVVATMVAWLERL
ncbi:alpha-beta hydrolase superfamily lysophospholipase [Rubricella aquisinus]|uniref:Alpha-beta hydrolase superfamily lysophospholipase n=1 Tax=Rubricella aquisinus TaxID=2028108 RepID=A0A840X1E4_9RHOB|nr:alpha/beta fold hydrolase [Rubricella aquisinus]MBB5516574.1 alpha-beta hydrolase superfamily lysophospholipase [Rubricella aquisinus]